MLYYARWCLPVFVSVLFCINYIFIHTGSPSKHETYRFLYFQYIKKLGLGDPIRSNKIQ